MDAARKERLGQKWVCFSCGARFYDLNKPEPLCPKCGVDQRTSPVLKAPPPRGKKKAAPPPPPPPPPSVVKEVPKRPKFADEEEEAAAPAEDDDEDFTVDLEQELAEDLDGEGIEVPETEPETEEPEEED
jgi:hypothetical protein